MQVGSVLPPGAEHSAAMASSDSRSRIAGRTYRRRGGGRSAPARARSLVGSWCSTLGLLEVSARTAILDAARGARFGPKLQDQGRITDQLVCV